MERTKCEIYSRCMGYYRPVSYWNTGKKAEFYSRKYFTNILGDNSLFVKKYENA